jgi:hypothetical protein
MAKTGSVIKAIKAKPNERGARSKLPLECSCKTNKVKCEEDFYVSYQRGGGKTKRICPVHWANGTRATQSERAKKSPPPTKVVWGFQWSPDTKSQVTQNSIQTTE